MVFWKSTDVAQASDVHGGRVCVQARVEHSAVSTDVAQGIRAGQDHTCFGISLLTMKSQRAGSLLEDAVCCSLSRARKFID